MLTKGEETKAHILRSAYAVFAHKGFTQVTMKDICEVTGLSRGGLYRHYDSCEHIFSDILSSFSTEQTLKFKEYIYKQLPASQILEMVLERYKKEMLDGSHSLTLAIYEFYHQNTNHKQISSLQTQYTKSYQAWKELIQYGIARGEFHDIDIESIYHLFIFSYQGVRMYSTIITINENIVNGMMEQIKQLLIEKGANHEQHIYST